MIILGILLTAFPLAFITAVIFSILGDETADLQVILGLWVVIAASILGPYLIWLAM